MAAKSKKTKKAGIPLSDRRVSDSEAMDLVIKAQAKAKALEVENRALKRGRDTMLAEFTDYRNRRRLPALPRKRKRTGRKQKVRVTVGDLHGMRMDRPAAEAFLQDLKEWDPDEIVLGGDMVEAGGWIAKHQPIGFQAATDYSYQEDIEAANWFLDALQAAAPRAVVHYLEGNHEDKVERLITDLTMAHGEDGAFLMDLASPRVLLRLEERGIRYYGRHVEHEKGLPPGWIRLGKILYVHELAGGKNAARSGLLSTAANVVYFHTHAEDTAAIDFPGVGLVKAWNSGCLCTLKPVWMHSKPTGWNHGYGVEFIDRNEEFLRIHVPIQDGKSYAGTMVSRLRG